MKKVFDEKKYWINRRKMGKLSSVGLKSHNETSNYYIYKIVTNQYKILLDRLEIKEKNVLDAGCGTGVFSEFFLMNGYTVSAFDISKNLILDGSRVNFKVKSIANFKSEKRFEIVHCFDVLYHILDDLEWKESLINLSQHSGNFIILHQRFCNHNPLICSKHIKFRPYSEITEVLKNQNFYEVDSIATHAIALRLPTYRLSNLSPRLFYEIDSLLLNLSNRFNLDIGSHHIKVFQKKI
jgi:SAM-dependent methyltransferase